MADAVLWIVALVLVAAGVAGTVLPVLPGPILVFLGILIVAWSGDFTRIGAATLVLLGVLTAVAHVIDLVSGVVGARYFGASGRAVVGAGLGVLAGLFLGLPGLIIGPFVGAAAGELSTRRDLGAAGRTGLAVWIGFLVGTAAKVAIVVGSIAIAAVAFFL